MAQAILDIILQILEGIEKISQSDLVKDATDDLSRTLSESNRSVMTLVLFCIHRLNSKIPQNTQEKFRAPTRIVEAMKNDEKILDKIDEVESKLTESLKNKDDKEKHLESLRVLTELFEMIARNEEVKEVLSKEASSIIIYLKTLKSMPMTKQIFEQLEQVDLDTFLDIGRDPIQLIKRVTKEVVIPVMNKVMKNIKIFPIRFTSDDGKDIIDIHSLSIDVPHPPQDIQLKTVVQIKFFNEDLKYVEDYTEVIMSLQVNDIALKMNNTEFQLYKKSFPPLERSGHMDIEANMNIDASITTLRDPKDEQSQIIVFPGDQTFVFTNLKVAFHKDVKSRAFFSVISKRLKKQISDTIETEVKNKLEELLTYICGGVNIIIQLASSQYAKLDLSVMQMQGSSMVESLINKIQ